MTTGNPRNEHSDVEAVELFITESLLKGKNVVIPDFGQLKLKSFGERRTVLFEPSGADDSFLRITPSGVEKEKKNTDAIYKLISLPLKDEKLVNLPKIGVFRPIKRVNGEIYISFILSGHLRKLLAEGEKKEELKPAKEIEKIADSSELKKEPQAPQKDEIITSGRTLSREPGAKPATETIQSANTTIKHRTDFPQRQRAAKVGDQIIPPSVTYEKSRSRNLSGTLLLFLAIAAIFAVIVTSINSKNSKKADERVDLALSNQSTSLPSLAEKYYGHSAFWIYIYKANSDKLDSPINIPGNISLVIPDLKVEYDVDMTDSMEILNANIMADIILKEKTKKK